MPTELKYQKLLVDSVKGSGGVAFKLANRHLVGVPDLFIQLPGHRTLILEAKLNKYKKMPEKALVVLTGPQHHFLLDLRQSGGLGGVVSFLEAGGKQYAAFVPVVPDFQFTVPGYQYSELCRGAREHCLITALTRYLEKGDA